MGLGGALTRLLLQARRRFIVAAAEGQGRLYVTGANRLALSTGGRDARPGLLFSGGGP